MSCKYKYKDNWYSKDEIKEILLKERGINSKGELIKPTITNNPKQAKITKENTTSIESVKNKFLNLFTTENNLDFVGGHISGKNAIEGEEFSIDNHLFKLIYDITTKNFNLLHKFKGANLWDKISKTDYKNYNGTDKIIKEQKNILKVKINNFEKREYTSQAETNLKVAALKEVARKYPRSLITSKVVPIDPNMVDNNEIQYSKIPSQEVKPGVEELFKQNPELVNSVYEALGFETEITQDNKSYYRGQIEQPTIDKNGNLVLYAKEDELYKRAGLKSKGVSMTDNLKSAIDYGNGQLEVARNLASESYDVEQELDRLSENGYYLIQIPKNISNEVVKEAGEVKVIGDKIIIPKGQYKIEQVIEGLEAQITPQQKQQAQQLYSQYLDSLNKPNANPILQNNQQEQVEKFTELQERLNNKEFLEGAKNVYESTPDLQQFGTQEQYNDYIARVSLGIIKNPTSGDYNYTSKVKDIVYHYNLSEKKFDKFDKNYIGTQSLGSQDSEQGFSFVDNKLVARAYGSFNTEIYSLPEEVWSTLDENTYKKYDTNIISALINPKQGDWKNTQNGWSEMMIKNPDNIHILGSKQDIDGFKEWTKSLETFKIEPSESLIQQYVTARESAYIQRAQELADNIPGLYSQVLKDNTLSTLREIAEQVYGVPGTEVEDQEFQANSMFGEELVNIAKELYPKEDIIDNNINVIRKLSDLPDINLEGSNIKCS